MNVVLVGYRGTGKSAVGSLLARQLGLRAVSLDAELQRRAGKSIPDIVQEVGWPGFRDLEEQVVATFAAQDGQVLDCGGGVIEREANFERLRAAGPVVWLKARTETIVRRIQGGRPSRSRHRRPHGRRHRGGGRGFDPGRTSCRGARVARMARAPQQAVAGLTLSG
ncbi:MAG: shikimate kinase [Pirellulaceae bacterium]|nr:shikimate kinase [Pirellulaceae bacterium]